MCLLMLDLPTRGESRIIKENGHEKAAAKNQKRESQNRSDSKATSKRSREASSRGDVTFDDASASRAEDTAAIGYMKSGPLKGPASHFLVLGICRPREICLGARYLVLTVAVCVCPPDLDRSTRRQ